MKAGLTRKILAVSAAALLGSCAEEPILTPDTPVSVKEGSYMISSVEGKTVTETYTSGIRLQCDTIDPAASFAANSSIVQLTADSTIMFVRDSAETFRYAVPKSQSLISAAADSAGISQLLNLLGTEVRFTEYRVTPEPLAVQNGKLVIAGSYSIKADYLYSDPDLAPVPMKMNSTIAGKQTLYGTPYSGAVPPAEWPQKITPASGLINSIPLTQISTKF